MIASETLASEKERLYESSALRDDLNDSEATVLLKWGESQIDRLAQEYPDDFEKKARFLRQLMKNINRFVGQREFNELEGQREYMAKFIKYLDPLGWSGMTEETFFAVLPEDKADMAANLDAILNILTPQAEATPPPSSVANPALPAPDVDTPEDENLFGGLENSNENSINLNSMYDSGESNSYGEE